ncbi:MAG: YjbF family lipoprotein [Rhodobacteraceae bacterium]|nr:YjbF family lipoprotein [Paracoccaceae bacterium]
MKRLSLSTLALSALAACGNDNTLTEFGQIAGEFQGLVVRSDDAGELPPFDAFATQLDLLVDGPLLVGFIPERQALAALVPFGENAGHISWSTEEKQSLVFRRGVLTSTRGLGDDLMSSEVSGTINALAAGGSSGHTRTYRYLDGNGATETIRMSCTLTSIASPDPSARAFQESCAEGTKKATNTYFVDRGGNIVSSVEYISATVGTIALINLSD